VIASGKARSCRWIAVTTVAGDPSGRKCRDRIRAGVRMTGGTANRGVMTVTFCRSVMDSGCVTDIADAVKGGGTAGIVGSGYGRGKHHTKADPLRRTGVEIGGGRYRVMDHIQVSVAVTVMAIPAELP